MQIVYQLYKWLRCHLSSVIVYTINQCCTLDIIWAAWQACKLALLIKYLLFPSQQTWWWVAKPPEQAHSQCCPCKTDKIITQSSSFCSLVQEELCFNLWWGYCPTMTSRSSKVPHLLLLWAVQGSGRMENSFLSVVKQLRDVLQVFGRALRKRRKICEYLGPEQEQERSKRSSPKLK